MMRMLLVMSVLYLFQPLQAQSSLLLTSGGQILQWNGQNCQTRDWSVSPIPVNLVDIVTDTSGVLYGINTQGQLFQIDSLGEVKEIHSFLNLQAYQALARSRRGDFFVIGEAGYLYSYSPVLDKEYYLGDIGNLKINSLIFWHDSLYAYTPDHEIWLIDLKQPSRSRFRKALDHTADVNCIWLAPSVAQNSEKCSSPSWLGISSNGSIYGIPLTSQTTTKHCINNASLTVIAATAQQADIISELYIRSVKTSPSGCIVPTGSLEVQTSKDNHLAELQLDDSIIQQQKRFEHLAAGLHHLKVIDQLGCRDSTLIEIARHHAPAIHNYELSEELCQANIPSIRILASGQGMLEFTRDTLPWQSSEVLDSVPTGTHLLIVRDSTFCSDSLIVTIDKRAASIDPVVLVTHASCGQANGTISLPKDGGLHWYLEGSPIMEDSMKDLNTGEYLLHWEDEKACSGDTLIAVNNQPCQVYIPTAISNLPESPNKRFQIYVPSNDRITVLDYLIYDRWGNLIYQAHNFTDQDETLWWDGNNGLRQAAPGAYLYSIKIKHLDGTIESFNGMIHLIS